MSFEILSGAAGDLRELEYISALHQTDGDVRRDCSIQAKDIQLYLSSRYGIDVTEKEVCSTILQGLGGSGDDDEVLDLMEVTALLFIPTLLKAAKQLQQDDSNYQSDSTSNRQMIQPPKGMLDYVLKMILHDTTGSSSAKPLTVELLNQVFQAYGEIELAEDKAMLQEMIDCVRSDKEDDPECPIMLDLPSFVKGLTGDVQLYDIRNETRLTTNYQDVFMDEIVRDASPAATAAMTFTSGMGEESEESLAKSLRNSAQEADGSANLVVDASKPLKRKFTAPSIDITAGTCRSKGLMVFLWTMVLISYFVYMWGVMERNANKICREAGVHYEFSMDAPWSDNAGPMACESTTSIALWLGFFLYVCVLGLAVVSLGSLGNHLQSPLWKPMVGAIVVALYSTALFFTYEFTASEGTYLAIVAFILGIITVLFHLSHMLVLLIPRTQLRQHPKIKAWLTASSVTAEMDLKRACSHKLSRMAQHALDIVRVNDKDTLALSTHFGQALDEYARSGKQYKRMGGFSWSWRRLWSRDAFCRDGMWISTRLIAGNISQCIVTLYILLAGINWVHYVSHAYDSGEAERAFKSLLHQAMIKQQINETAVEEFALSMGGTIGAFLQNSSVVMHALSDGNVSSASSAAATGCGDFFAQQDSQEFIDSLCSTVNGTVSCGNTTSEPDLAYLCPLIADPNLDHQTQAALLNASGLDTDAIMKQTQHVMQSAVDETVDSLFPSQKYMVMIPTIVGVVIAVLTAVYLAITYMPSVLHTVLQLRSGAIPTLRDNGFNRYRVAPDQVAILTGSLFWGCLVASIAVGGLFALIIFLFLWQVTAYFAQRFVAIAIGVITITLLRVIMVNLCRCRFYTAFYRQKPASANITLLGLEWASFALSFGFVFLRMIKLLLVTAGFIGRIDRPFLAEGVGRIACIEIDNYPVVHTKDLLSQEAHRHPFIELLGVMYMMKLRYTDHFGKSSGSCWRLLFVYALFPWLHRYRIGARPENFAITATKTTHRPSLPNGSPLLQQLDFVSLRKLGSDHDDEYGNNTPPTVAVDQHSQRHESALSQQDLALADCTTDDDKISIGVQKNSSAGAVEVELASAAMQPSTELEKRQQVTIQELQAELARLKQELLMGNATIDRRSTASAQSASPCGGSYLFASV